MDAPDNDEINRLERIEALLSDTNNRLLRMESVRDSWTVFFVIGGLHVLLIYAGLVLQRFVGFRFPVPFVGTAVTVAVWLGLSLRTRTDKLARMLAGILAVIVAIPNFAGIANGPFENVYYVVLSIAGGYLLSSVVRHTFACGLRAPDGDSREPAQVSLQRMFAWITAVAVLIALLRASGGVSPLQAIAVFTLGFAIPVTLVSVATLKLLAENVTRAEQRAVTVMCIAAVLLLNVVLGVLTGMNEVVAALLMSIYVVVSPVMTFRILHVHGHRVVGLTDVNGPSSSDESLSPAGISVD